MICLGADFSPGPTGFFLGNKMNNDSRAFTATSLYEVISIFLFRSFLFRNADEVNPQVIKNKLKKPIAC